MIASSYYPAGGSFQWPSRWHSQESVGDFVEPRQGLLRVYADAHHLGYQKKHEWLSKTSPADSIRILIRDQQGTNKKWALPRTLLTIPTLQQISMSKGLRTGKQCMAPITEHHHAAFWGYVPRHFPRFRVFSTTQHVNRNKKHMAVSSHDSCWRQWRNMLCPSRPTLLGGFYC